MSKKRIFARQMARSLQELGPQQLANVNGGMTSSPGTDFGDGGPVSATSYQSVSGSPRVLDGDSPDTD